MIQVRTSMFETNSSSTHSIVVSYDKKIQYVTNPYQTHYATYENGVLRLCEDNSFGWGWEVLTDWKDKFAYAVAELRFRTDELEDLLNKVKERLGCTEIIIPDRTLWNDETQTEPDYGYIDHQSHGTLLCFLSETGTNVIDFIFDDKYGVILDNDNNYGDRYDEFVGEFGVEDYPADRYW